MERLIANPIPLPWGLVVKNASKICSGFSLGNPTPVSVNTVLLATFSGLPCSEPERVRLQYIYLYLIKTCCFQAFRECTWVHHHHSVEQVEQSKFAAVKAVRTCENSAGTQHATYFRQQAVLQCLRRNMMEHRETHRGIECRLRQEHGGGVLVEHRDIVVRHAALQGIGGSSVDFYACNTIDPSSQEIRRDAGTRTNFENAWADVETLKDPRKDIGFDGLQPIIRPAEPAVCKIHRGELPPPRTA